MHSSSIIEQQQQQHEEQQQQQPVKKKTSFRRLSFFKPSSYSPSSCSQSSISPTLTASLQQQQIITSPVLTTNTINKEYDPETGNKIINNFMIIKEIGRGMHGKVKLAQDLDTGELVAIKIVDKASRKRQLGYSILRENNNNNNNNNSSFIEESEEKIRREIAILKKCSHPHVVQLREVMDDTQSRKIYLALEYMEGGEIIWRQDQDSTTPVLTLNESRNIFRDVVSGLDYLHYQGIIHRDIKPANLLLTKDQEVKISDFGVSYFNPLLKNGAKEYNQQVIDRELAETAGTPAFFAPELCCTLDAQSTTTHITKAIDIWALGVTLYCFIFGQCPFTASTEFELFDIIPTQPLTFPFTIPPELQDLLERLLTKDPQERITLEQVKQHPWVIQDLSPIDIEIWLKESDPTLYKTVQVTDEDVSHAFTTIMDKLKRSIHRISSSFLFHPFLHHHHHHHSRSKSSSSTGHAAASVFNHNHNQNNTSAASSSSNDGGSDIMFNNSSSSPISSHTYHYQQQQYQLDEHDEDEEEEEEEEEEDEYNKKGGGGEWLPKSFTKMTLVSSSSSSSNSTNHNDTTPSITTEQQQHHQIPPPVSLTNRHPFQLDGRNDSSGSSSMSGLFFNTGSSRLEE